MFRRKHILISFLSLLLLCVVTQPVQAGRVDRGVEAFRNYDYIKALSILRPLAEKGNARAQYYLGILYDEGKGLMQDKTEAQRWFEKAHEGWRKRAEKRFAEAQEGLGTLYETGRGGVPKDYKQALKWYRKAAELGYAEAEASLGQMYFFGRGVPKDHTQAFKWALLAAEKDLTWAKMFVGFMYLNGYGVAKDYREADTWLRQAASRGNPAAKNYRGILYRDHASKILNPLEFALTNYNAEAVKLFREAAEQGFPDAQVNLGWMYANGRGVAKDNVEALKWYRMAAAHNNAIAQYNLGVMYEKGLGVSQDEAEAVKWYRTAAENGGRSGQRALGLRYATGQGVTRDNAAALVWLRKAAAQGDEEAKKAVRQQEIVRKAKEKERIGQATAAIKLYGQAYGQAIVMKNQVLVDSAFNEVVRLYHTVRPKPSLSEDGRRYLVQANTHIREKRYREAATAYGKLIGSDPWWPEGFFNRAHLYGRFLKNYDAAIAHMKRYLQLAPNAKNARVAQDKVYEWEAEKKSVALRAARARSLSATRRGAAACFVATAAYGSYLHPKVKALRDFRDNYLLTNRPGRAFVAFYYRTSPPIADVIKRHESLRAITRWGLTPIVYALLHPWATLLAVFGLILTWLGYKYIRARSLSSHLA